MDQSISTLLILLACTSVVGLMVGFVISRRLYLKRADAAYGKAKDELHKEKESLSADLTVQLTKMREGILQSVEAYKGAVETVQDRLPVTDEQRESMIGLPNTITIEPQEEQLTIEEEAANGEGMEKEQSKPVEAIAETEKEAAEPATETEVESEAESGVIH